MTSALALLVVAAQAQTFNVAQGSIRYAFPAEQVGEMPFSGGTTLTIMDKTFSVDEIDSIYVDFTEVDDNTVVVAYADGTATVTVAGNVACYVTPTVSGAHVSIVQGSDVGEDTCGEITYSLSGQSDDGSFYMDGSYKASIDLRGLALTNPSGAALDIDNGKRIDLSVKSGTENTLVDGASGSQKGCIDCKGHLELKGKGTLNVYGNTSHAIYAKEYVEMKNCTVNVLSAVKDGLNCNQYFLMESGELYISGVGDDAVQVSFKDDEDRDEEDTGSITISGGTIVASVTATASKGLKADGDVLISGGTVSVVTSGGGEWDEDDAKTKASACISADGMVTIEGGEIVLTSTGSGGKGISCDGDLVINDGDLSISTSGGLYAYINGREYSDYTGDTDNLDSDLTSSPKGVKADGDITINGGNISVVTTGTNAEGIESKSELVINGGTIKINSYDDGLNSSSHMYINGGELTIISTANDAIDSNGNMYINGGYTMALGSPSPEGGIDANEEDGYSVYFNGGTLLAVGGDNSVPSSSTSTQAYVSTMASVSSGSTVTLYSGATTLATFDIPEEYEAAASSGSMPGNQGPGGGFGQGSTLSVLITCPDLSSGSRYTLSTGNNSTATVTARLTGNSSGRN